MKLYAPKYYGDFSCIASRCRHNCCIGWEIDVDARSMARYKAFSSGYGASIPNSIDQASEEPHFKLAEGERCPHLNDCGLCNIILQCGEEYLCDICREHPRFYHNTSRGKEVGVGMACEEACRLIRENLKRTKLERYGRVIRSDYMAFLRSCKEKFDIILLDPPYAEVFLENSLIMITEIDILQSGGIIVTERPVGKELPWDFPGFERSRDYKYGNTLITIYRKL